MENSSSPNSTKKSTAFGILRALIFLGLGISILASDIAIHLGSSTRIGLGCILIVYGIFRAVKDLKK